MQPWRTPLWPHDSNHRASGKPGAVHHGGFNRINKVFDGQLETILGEINEALWKQAAGSSL